MTPSSRSDEQFAGSIPRIYEDFLVPLIFEPYATDLRDRVVSVEVLNVLELAAGTGVVTRALASAQAPFSITATDLSQEMLNAGAAIGTARPVDWQQADASALPFPDDSFDVVVCQFGVMFFPDRPHAHAEALRVLRPGGRLIFNTWDQISDNEFADVVQSSLQSVFPDDPPKFLERTPHGYHDLALIEKDVRAGGFSKEIQIVTVAARSQASTARIPAIAYCQGTPLRNEIESRDASRLQEATAHAEKALSDRFGSDFVDGKIQGHVVTAWK